MRFGGLVAIDACPSRRRRGEITALIGPNGAGKTTVFNCITGFYKPTVGRMALRQAPSGAATAEIRGDAPLTRLASRALAGAVFLLERMPDFEIAAKGRVARTFQNIRLFSGMTVLENLIVAQHNALMRASGFTSPALLGLPAYKRAAERGGDRARANTGSSGSA